MDEPPDRLLRQYERQLEWLKEHYLHLIGIHVIEKRAWKRLPKALDVGCGPGLVMEALSRVMDVHGVDMDYDWVSLARARGLDVVEGRAEELPFEDGEFDVVYCTWVLMWVKDPVKVLKEMARVSKRWVLALAEPDYASRIDHPGEIIRLRDILIDGIKAKGADPLMGRKLMALFSEASLKAEVGIHPGSYDNVRQEEEIEDEWAFIREVAADRVPKKELDALMTKWDKARRKGTLFQFSPTFYAIGEK